MCGILGYVGAKDAPKIVFNGLSRLEYRGYDSAGISVLHEGVVQTRKSEGKMNNLKNLMRDVPLVGQCAIGHTRWATHGVPSKNNAHPHLNAEHSITVVHNGIIENHHELRGDLEKKGAIFNSDTDTEVIPHLISEYMKEGADFETAFTSALERFEGAYALAAMHKDYPDLILASRKGSPLVLGIGKGEYFLASDVPAIIEYTKDFIYLDEKSRVVLRSGGYEVYDENNVALAAEVVRVEMDVEAAEKQGYEHFMLKEIYEQPAAISKTIAGKIDAESTRVKLDELDGLREKLKGIRNIITLSCGTAWHAGVVGKYAIEEVARIPVEVRMASEFRYGSPVIDEYTLILAISQSGETADTLESIRRAKSKGATVISICNVVGSSIARLSDVTLYTHAGPEIGVASTKAYTTQLAMVTLFALYRGQLKSTVTQSRLTEVLTALREVPQQIEKILQDTSLIKRYAEKYSFVYNFMYIGRNYNYPTAAEGALKLKEISYIHAEGYAAGEMKHGPLALVDELFPTIAIAVGDEVQDKMLSNIQEIIARKGKVVAIACEGDDKITSLVEDCIFIPKVLEILSPILAVIPAQLFAYYIALNRGCDVDQPRNLAKSVTVE